MVLRADDGTPLKVQEPIVLGQDGEEILTPPTEPVRPETEDFSYAPRGRVFRLSGWWVLLALAAIIPFLFLGAAFFVFVVVGAFVLWALRTVLRALNL